MAGKQGPYPPRHDPPAVKKVMSEKPVSSKQAREVDRKAAEILRRQQAGDTEGLLKK